MAHKIDDDAYPLTPREILFTDVNSMSELCQFLRPIEYTHLQENIKVLPLPYLIKSQIKKLALRDILAYSQNEQRNDALDQIVDGNVECCDKEWGRYVATDAELATLAQLQDTSFLDFFPNDIASRNERL
jgi:hypothetical protein